MSDPSSPLLLPALPGLHGGYKGVASGPVSLAGRPRTFLDFRPQEYFRWFGNVCERCKAGGFSCRSEWPGSVSTCRLRAGLGHVLPWARHCSGHGQQLLVPAQAPEHCRLQFLLAARACGHADGIWGAGGRDGPPPPPLPLPTGLGSAVPPAPSAATPPSQSLSPPFTPSPHLLPLAPHRAGGLLH